MLGPGKGSSFIIFCSRVRGQQKKAYTGLPAAADTRFELQQAQFAAMEKIS